MRRKLEREREQEEKEKKGKILCLNLSARSIRDAARFAVRFAVEREPFEGGDGFDLDVELREEGRKGGRGS